MRYIDQIKLPRVIIDDFHIITWTNGGIIPLHFIASRKLYLQSYGLKFLLNIYLYLPVELITHVIVSSHTCTL